MFYKLLTIALLSSVIGFNIPLAQIDSPSKTEVDLGFQPGHASRMLAEMKARSLARQFEKENLLRPETRAEIDKYDVIYYDIFWRPDFSDSTIYGEVTMHAVSLDPGLGQVWLFLHENMIVDSVYNASGELPATHQGGLLIVHLDRVYQTGEQFNFTVVYKGHPPPYDLFYDGLMFTKHDGVPIVENLSEPYSARQWWPCKDVPWDKADSSDVRINVAAGMVGTSNGLLISDIDQGDGTHTMHWKSRYPITTYLICLAVTNYHSYTDYYHYSPTDSMAIVNYVFPEKEDDPRLALDVTPLAISVFSDLFCEYPFLNEKYGHSMCNVHGMEHQTNTFLNFFYLCDEPTIVHELAHHWWGNLVTCQSWEHIWLNEGFGTYAEALFYEAVNGPEYLHAYMSGIEYRAGGTVYVYDISEPMTIFSLRSYWKGAWVAHMLRGVVGDAAFFSALRQYASTYAYGNASSDDLQQVMEAVSGQDLDYFFQEWLHGEYFPIYRYAYFLEDNPSGGSDIYLHIRQRQDTEPQVFGMPLKIHLQTSTGEVTDVVFNDKREQNFTLHQDVHINSVTVDPDHWILRDILWEEYNMHIVTEELSPPNLAEDYCDTIIVKGGSGSYLYEHISGDLPAGWDLDAGTGILSGCCVNDGSYTFAVRVTDTHYPAYYLDSATYTVTMGIPSPRPGDANADSQVDVGDAVFLINYIFRGGQPPPVIDWGDVNADCAVNVGDVVYLISYIFKGGSAPQMGCVP